MQELLKKIQGDKVIWMVVFILSLVSLLAVYSSISSLAYKADGNSFKFLFKHFFMLVLGLSVMFVVHKMKFKYFSRLSQLMLYTAIIMLILTFLFGIDVNNAKRWIRIPYLQLTFQTSDFAKIALITYVARTLSLKRTILHDFKKGVVPVIWPIVVVCGLILPADFSTAALLAGTCFILIFIGGIPWKHLLKIIAGGIVALMLTFAMGKAFPEALPRIDTWINRIADFGDSESDGNYQIDFAQVAINEGGLFPSGPGSGNSRNFLPHPYSDMIYAFIIEEYGSILGGFCLLMLYLIFTYRSIRIATRTPKHFGGLLTLGLAFLLFFQALINMAVAVNLFPTTGQPLPLVSMGGTSVIFTCLSIGMILSVSRSVYNKEEWNKEQNSPPQNEQANQNEYQVA
ncbi:MAG: FtsW/RodA/SpoVE family cell cycle protein [Flavobacteriales bacterium]